MIMIWLAYVPTRINIFPALDSKHFGTVAPLF